MGDKITLQKQLDIVNQKCDSLNMTNEINKNEIERIRGLLLAFKGITLTQIAKEFGVSRQFAHQVIRGVHNSEKAESIRNYISEMIQAGGCNE